MDHKGYKLFMRSRNSENLSFLLIGPYDPSCGEYTFLAPPLGVWRLCGHLSNLGYRVVVFDPNCCGGDPPEKLRALLRREHFDVIGVSTTGMTLRYDLSLAHLVRRVKRDVLMIAGGMEATFNPELVSRLGPFDLIILGDGEKPLTDLARRLQVGESLDGIPSTAVPLKSGGVHKYHGPAMNYQELKDAIYLTPYELMPYGDYWDRLERAYSVRGLPEKASREARLSEIRSVRIATLNYCPMGCTFCSSTNFLHAAQGSVAKVARLTADDCLDMIEKVVKLHPYVRTVIFQDDIFVFTNDNRIEPLCMGIMERKGRSLPRDLQFISTNRIDAMTPARLTMMKQAGFRVLGFGVESFSSSVLKEFNKAHIYRHIEPNLSAAIRLGITPFLDLILSSPRSGLDDVATTISEAYRWITLGCEIGLYPYVIPFSGSAMSRDPSLVEYTESVIQDIPGTTVSWKQPSRILPVDLVTREVMWEIEAGFEDHLSALIGRVEHLPSRVRSLLWVHAALPVLSRMGYDMPVGIDIIARIDSLLGQAAWPDMKLAADM